MINIFGVKKRDVRRLYESIMSVHAGYENLTPGVGISTKDEACRVPGWNSYPEDEISLSYIDWLMMESFSPTFKWIVPRTSLVMWGRRFSYGQKAYLI